MWLCVTSLFNLDEAGARGCRGVTSLSEFRIASWRRSSLLRTLLRAFTRGPTWHGAVHCEKRRVDLRHVELRALFEPQIWTQTLFHRFFFFFFSFFYAPQFDPGNEFCEFSMDWLHSSNRTEQRGNNKKKTPVYSSSLFTLVHGSFTRRWRIQTQSFT